jgi:hypothetical protein
MNAVEIEEAVSALAVVPFDAESFPYAFLEAFGNKETTIKRLKSGETNQSDIPGGVLQRNNIHLKTCPAGEVSSTLTLLRESGATARYKAKFILATDGRSFEAESLFDGETIACDYEKFSDHFGFFLALAGISTVREIRENAFDIKATSRLNKLYIELLKENPGWDTAERREALNHFFARLIFCFFAEDTNIFGTNARFTSTVEQMSAPDASNTHEVLAELFRSMNMKPSEREAAKIRSWAMGFPYVNGGLFSDSLEVPRFSKIARSYLIHVGHLDWTKINPDIFGSMIQAVADDEERGELGMHYTSVPNILKVLNPLFLDDLRTQLAEAGDNSRKLLNLRNRMSRIRVFDPACGSGNFLVIAYKEMRVIEAEINKRRKESDLRSVIPLTNFRGIEIRHFSAEIARLALIIAEYQCDVLYRGQRLALAEFLPLEAANWITCGNALRIDWLSICPPTGTGVKLRADDLFSTPLNQAEIDFTNEGGETYICGNPPYLGTKYQTKIQKAELATLFGNDPIKFGNVDYVGGWIRSAADFISRSPRSSFALVSTTSVFQGEQSEIVYWILKRFNLTISWCHTAFKWSNQATNNAGVSCCIVGISHKGSITRKVIYDGVSARTVSNIGSYLVGMPDVVVTKRSAPLARSLSPMSYGSMSNDNNSFTLSFEDYRRLLGDNPDNNRIMKFAVGGNEFINGIIRPAIYIEPETVLSKDQLSCFASVFERVREYRAASNRAATKKLSETPMFFAERRHFPGSKIFVPQILSERRPYITAGLLDKDALVIAPHMQILNGELYNFAILSSRLHLVWISTVCGKLETRLRYSNTLGWNTFPVPPLTDQNEADLKCCAEAILLAREAHFPATIADLYDPENMPSELRDAHEYNDETLERIYIGRRFKTDTERLEKLFELYTTLTSQSNSKKGDGCQNGRTVA